QLDRKPPQDLRPRPAARSKALGPTCHLPATRRLQAGLAARFHLYECSQIVDVTRRLPKSPESPELPKLRVSITQIQAFQFGNSGNFFNPSSPNTFRHRYGFRASVPGPASYRLPPHELAAMIPRLDWKTAGL